jgi:hypothetical protein
MAEPNASSGLSGRSKADGIERVNPANDELTRHRDSVGILDATSLFSV